MQILLGHISLWKLILFCKGRQGRGAKFIGQRSLERAGKICGIELNLTKCHIALRLLGVSWTVFAPRSADFLQGFGTADSIQAALKRCCGRAWAVGAWTHEYFPKELVLISLRGRKTWCRKPPGKSWCCRKLVGTCMGSVPCRGVWAKIADCSWRPRWGSVRWMWEFRSGGDVKHKCTPKPLLGSSGVSCMGEMLLHLRCKPTLCHCLALHYSDDL